MDKFVANNNVGITAFFVQLVRKLMQRHDFYPIRHYERMRRDRSPWLTH